MSIDLGLEDQTMFNHDSHILCDESLLSKSRRRNVMPSVKECLSRVGILGHMRHRIYSSQGDPLMILSGMGNGHNKMIWSCDWNENGILTAGLDRSICLWEVRP